MKKPDWLIHTSLITAFVCKLGCKSFFTTLFVSQQRIFYFSLPLFAISIFSRMIFMFKIENPLKTKTFLRRFPA